LISRPFNYTTNIIREWGLTREGSILEDSLLEKRGYKRGGINREEGLLERRVLLEKMAY
jgi:hypothetical protein